MHTIAFINCSPFNEILTMIQTSLREISFAAAESNHLMSVLNGQTWKTNTIHDGHHNQLNFENTKMAKTQQVNKILI